MFALFNFCSSSLDPLNAEAKTLLDDLKGFHQDVANKELNDETWQKLYADASGPTAAKFHVVYKKWRKLRSVPDSILKLAEQFGPYLGIEFDMTVLKVADAAIHDRKEEILNYMGELSAVQVLARPLAPGEVRANVAKRVADGLAKDPAYTMRLSVPLSLALKAALPAGKV